MSSPIFDTGKWQPQPIMLRPYQLLCMLCLLGEYGAPAEERDSTGGEAVPRPHLEERLRSTFNEIREQPDRPVGLQCDAGDVFVYQNLGEELDSPEGREFNIKRDLDILRAIDQAPGGILPARIFFRLIKEKIPAASGICGYETETAPAWRGCPRAMMGFYERGASMDMEEILPVPPAEIRAAEKRDSIAAMEDADAVSIRPHLLLCAVCQYGNNLRPPFEEDNLPELLQLLLKKPDTPIRMARGADWMMCAPCKKRVPELNACVNVWGAGGLSNELRDLNVLRILGLVYGETLRASELFRLLFTRMPDTKAVCSKDNAKPSVWWDGCGDLAEGSNHYVEGRRLLMELGLGK